MARAIRPTAGTRRITQGDVRQARLRGALRTLRLDHRHRRLPTALARHAPSGRPGTPSGLKFGDTGHFAVFGLDGKILLQTQWPEHEGKHYTSVGTDEMKRIRGEPIALGAKGGGVAEYPGAGSILARKAVLARSATAPPSSRFTSPGTSWWWRPLFEQEMEPAIAAERRAIIESVSSRLPFVALAAGLALLLAIIASYFFSR